VEALVSGLENEIQILHAQADNIRTLVDQTRADAGSAVPAPSAEDEEVRKIKEMIHNSPDLINAPGQNSMTPLQGAVILFCVQ
jgi:hypothetical protein